MPGSNNIILTGFMGTGKTTVGRLLSKRLGREFVDTDHLIQQRFGPIETIFTTEGEGRFREIERLVASELATRSDLVISTGGGMLIDEENAAMLLTTGRVFCLTASTTELRRRLSRTAKSRPLLDGAETWETLLEQREAAYARFRQVDTTDLTPQEVAEAVAEMLP